MSSTKPATPVHHIFWLLVLSVVCQYFCPIEMYVFNRAFKFGLGEGGGSRGTCDFLEGGMTRYGMSDLTADFHPPIQALI